MIVKLYGDPNHVVHVSGQTEPGTANTCFSERHNWTMRTMRRDTGRSNGFSLTEAENHRPWWRCGCAPRLRPAAPDLDPQGQPADQAGDGRRRG